MKHPLMGLHFLASVVKVKLAKNTANVKYPPVNIRCHTSISLCTLHFYSTFSRGYLLWLLVGGHIIYIYIYIYCEFNMNAKARDTWGIGEVIESFVIYREDKRKGQSSRALKNGCKCVGRFSAGRSTRSFFLHFQRDFPSRRHPRFLS